MSYEMFNILLTNQWPKKSLHSQKSTFTQDMWQLTFLLMYIVY